MVLQAAVIADAKAIPFLEYNSKQCVVLQAAVIADAQGSLSRDKLRKENCGADVSGPQTDTAGTVCYFFVSI